MVSLHFFDPMHSNDPQKFRHDCGATIISDDTLLTAAHCLDGAAVSSEQQHKSQKVLQLFRKKPQVEILVVENKFYTCLIELVNNNLKHVQRVIH